MTFEYRYPRLARASLRSGLLYPFVGLPLVVGVFAWNGWRSLPGIEGWALLIAAGALAGLTVGLYLLRNWARIGAGLMLAISIGIALVHPGVEGPNLLEAVLGGALATYLLAPSTGAHFAFARGDIPRDELARELEAAGD